VHNILFAKKREGRARTTKRSKKNEGNKRIGEGHTTILELVLRALKNWRGRWDGVGMGHG
jgi:hypothetical protein